MPLKVSDGIAAYIDDFKKSDAPQFKGKSNKERRDQAIAAYLSAKKGDEQKENIKTSDRKPEIYTKPDGKRGVRMVPVDREVIKKEATSKHHDGVREGNNYKVQVSGPDGAGVHKVKAKSQDHAHQIVMKKIGQSKLPKHMQPKTRIMGESVKEAIKHTHAVVDGSGKVAGMTSNERDAKDIARRHKGKVIKLKKPMSPKKGDMMINRPFKESVKEEMNFAVSIEGLPQMFISADSPGMLKQTLRKIVKQPSMIQNVKRVTDAQVKKTFRLKAQGREEESEE